MTPMIRDKDNSIVYQQIFTGCPYAHDTVQDPMAKIMIK